VTARATTLIELMEANRRVARNITYLEGENDARDVSFAELYERALGILYHLQRLGARRGDKLILFLGNNEQFIDVFWAAILGGIVPVPVGAGRRGLTSMKMARALPPWTRIAPLTVVWRFESSRWWL